MLKILLTIFLLYTTAFAYSTQDFLYDINATYSDKFYENILSEEQTTTLIDFENNSAQKKIKEDFEKLLPKYLESDNLFTNKELSKLQETKYIISQSHFKDFLTVSTLYLNLLNYEKKRQQSNVLLEKNLINLRSLMQNSNDMINYILSIILYKKLYADIKCDSKKTYGLFKKFPPPDKSIFFKKFEYEKQEIISLLDINLNHIDTVDKKDYNEVEYKKLMTQVSLAAKKYVNKYYNEMAVVIKLESNDEMKRFYKYIEKEENEHLSYWNLPKMILSSLKARVYNILFGGNEDYGYFAYYIGKTLAFVSLPKLDTIYLDHIEMIEQYEILLKTYVKEYE